METIENSTISELRARIEQLEMVLKQVEWVQDDLDAVCPWCHAVADWGWNLERIHKSDCPRQNALGITREPKES